MAAEQAEQDAWLAEAEVLAEERRAARAARLAEEARAAAEAAGASAGGAIQTREGTGGSTGPAVAKQKSRGLGAAVEEDLLDALLHDMHDP